MSIEFPHHRRNCNAGFSRTFYLGLAFIVLVAMLLAALYGWTAIYERYLKRTPPIIKFDEQQPRGIGISPVSVAFTVYDVATGLDEVVVRVHQKGSSKEVLRSSLNGEHEKHISVDFPGEKSNLEEGPMQLEVKVFDRSFWNNSAEQTIDLPVDYRKPRIEPITTMHNTRRGGSQLMFYHAVDQSLAFSGVKVGNETFLGFPARGIDKDFEDPTVFVALYALDMQQADQEPPVRLFAQDIVGNAASATFPNRILPRPERTQNVNLSDDFMIENISELTERNMSKMKNFAADMGKKIEYTTAAGTPERSVEQFNFINQYLRVLNERELVGLLKKGGRFERYWTGPFIEQNGIVNTTFGDTINYRYQDKIIATTLQTGFDIAMPKSASDVLAAADGVIIFNENLGVYGRVVGVDHGLGLVSIYGKLDSVLVKEGDTVTASQPIATAGRTGFARFNEVYYELRLQGVPIDPREWWDKSWYYGHIADQISTAKKIMEIPSSNPVDSAL